MASTPTLLPGHRKKWLKRRYEAPWTLDGDTLDRVMDHLRQTGDLDRGDCWEILMLRIAGRVQRETDFRRRLEGKLLLSVAKGRYDEAERLKKQLARLEVTGLRVITSDD